jgi:hypothetical protein
MAIGPRVLIIEDEPLIALELETIVLELGCVCIGPVMEFEQGLHLAKTADVDCAIVNLILGDNQAYPIVEALFARGIPFGFASGVLQAGIPPEWSDRPFLDKPYGMVSVQRLVETVLGRAVPQPPLEAGTARGNGHFDIETFASSSGSRAKAPRPGGT